MAEKDQMCWMWQTVSGRAWIATASISRAKCLAYVLTMYGGVTPPGKPVRVRITPVEAKKGMVKRGK